MTILLVDDEESQRILWRYQLAPLEAVIVEAGDLVEALKMMRGVPPPDLVFLDLTMPGSSPENTMSHIREIKTHNTRALVVIFTGQVRDDLRDLSDYMLADGYFVKNTVVLEAALLRALQTLFAGERAMGLVWTSDVRNRINALLA